MKTWRYQNISLYFKSPTYQSCQPNRITKMESWNAWEFMKNGLMFRLKRASNRLNCFIQIFPIIHTWTGVKKRWKRGEKVSTKWLWKCKRAFRLYTRNLVDFSYENTHLICLHFSCSAMRRARFSVFRTEHISSCIESNKHVVCVNDTSNWVWRCF